MPQDLQTVSIKELRDHLADYLSKAQRGQEVVVTNHGRVIAKIGPVKSKSRIAGVLKGKIPPQPADAWDFPEDLTAIMEGEIDE